MSEEQERPPIGGPYKTFIPVLEDIESAAEAGQILDELAEEVGSDRIYESDEFKALFDRYEELQQAENDKQKAARKEQSWTICANLGIAEGDQVAFRLHEPYSRWSPESGDMAGTVFRRGGAAWIRLDEQYHAGTDKRSGIPVSSAIEFLERNGEPIEPYWSTGTEDPDDAEEGPVNLDRRQWWKYPWMKAVGRKDWELYLDESARLLAELGVDPDDPRVVLSPRNDSRHRVAIILHLRNFFSLNHHRDQTFLGIQLSEKVPEDLPLEPTFHFKRPPTNRIYAITPRAYREHRDRLFPMIVKAAREFLPATGKARQAVHHVPDIGRMTLDQAFRKDALDHILSGEGDWPGEDLPSMDMGDFDRIASQFKKEELQLYLSLVRTLMLQLDVRPGDERTALSCAMEDRLSFTIGNRYTLVLSTGEQRYWFLSSEFADDPRIVNDSFKGSPVARHLSTNEPEALFGQWPHVLIGARRELERTNSSKYRKYNHPRFMAAVEAAEPLEHLMNEQPRAAVNEPLNLILYGPPGTGKTYTLKNEFFDRFTTRVERLTREQRLTELVEELTWWQVVAMVLLDLGPSKASAIMEHELLQTKARLSSSANIRATVWGTLQTHTVLECPLVAYKGRLEPLLFNKQENSIWEVLPNLMDELAPELRGLLEQSKREDQGDSREVKRYEFVTFHQSFSYEDFVEGIKPHLGETDDIGYEVKDGVFKRMCAKAEQDPENNYALFIDEINRGNVASIFGELITLLEDDKRLRRPQALTTTLPYSKKTFGVPPNLYVIGTMNTADRSVEALDTALRRRFSFREMPARPDLLNGQQLGGVDLQRLLSTINERVEQLLDKDHHIGHSYFMSISSGDDLKRVFANKVLPLLDEYFHGDARKVGAVLGKAFVEKKESTTPLATGFDLDEYETRTLYVVKDPMRFSDLSPFRAVYEEA